MPDITTTGVVGVDGYTPLYEPNDKWRIWALHEIYMGDEGQNKFVPKVNDYVMEVETGKTYVVVSIDNVTLVPTLSPVGVQTDEGVVNDEYVCTSYRVYFDNSTDPNTLTVDGTFKVYGSAATYARIYKGTLLNDANLISHIYNNSGDFVSHDIQLETVAMNTHDVQAVKSIPSCNTTSEDLQDGEVVTVVVYDSNGKVLVRKQMIIENATFIPPALSDVKYVTQIALKTPFLDINNDTTINYPVNLPVEGFNPIAVVYYNDGSKVEYPIDGDKFRLYGLDQFVSTIIGHRVPLVLSYRLGLNEAAVANVNYDGHFITRDYTLIVSNPNTSYNAKLYVIPRWIDEVSGYSYVIYMLNLDRNIFYDVTDKVSIAATSPSFDGKAYGQTQRLTFTVDLNKVSPTFSEFIHVQTVDIVLRAPATDDSNPTIWEINTQYPSNTPYYGTNLKATGNLLTAPTSINISNGELDLDTWLTKVYYHLEPLQNIITEIEPIRPSHVTVFYEGQQITDGVTIPIEDYQNDIDLGVNLEKYKNVYLVFRKKTPLNQYLNLAVGAMTIR